MIEWLERDYCEQQIAAACWVVGGVVGGGWCVDNRRQSCTVLCTDRHRERKHGDTHVHRVCEGRIPFGESAQRENAQSEHTGKAHEEHNIEKAHTES